MIHQTNKKSGNKGDVTIELNRQKKKEISMDQLILILLIVVFYATAIVFGTIKLPSLVDVAVLIILLTMLLIPSIWIALNIHQHVPQGSKAELPEAAAQHEEAPPEEYFAQKDLASMKAYSDLIH